MSSGMALLVRIALRPSVSGMRMSMRTAWQKPDAHVRNGSEQIAAMRRSPQFCFYALHGGRPDRGFRGDDSILGKHHVPALQFVAGLAMLEGRICPSSGPAPQTP